MRLVRRADREDDADDDEREHLPAPDKSATDEESRGAIRTGTKPWKKWPILS
jgi:hypothetical protein